MSIRRIEFVLTGVKPLLMHSDSITWSDTMEEWRNKAENKAIKKAGDDRVPAWTWTGYAYVTGDERPNFHVPVTNIQKCLSMGGQKVPLPNKGNQNFGALLMSSVLLGGGADGDEPEFRVNGKPLSAAVLEAAQKPDLSFKQQQEMAQAAGFDLLINRVVNPSTRKKNIRVRPMFRNWSIAGWCEVDDPLITQDVIQSAFDIAGRRVGLGDWRPGTPKPGPFGTFKVTLGKPAKK